MRRLIGIALMFIAMTGIASADEVDATSAINVAKTAISTKCPGLALQDATLTALKDGDEVCMYVVNFKPQGWVLVAADDAMQPVLGYSDSGSFSTEGLPVNLHSWIDCHKTFVAELRKKARVTGVSHRHEEWDAMESGRLNNESVQPALTSRASNSVAPLINVNWNQTGYYNAYCPSDKNGRAVVGCVAVAMGQAISVCQYPARPEGACSYTHSTYGTIYVNYDNEAAYNWSDIMSGANNKSEVARLLYHCGVSVHMDYGVDGSGAMSSEIANALKKYFGYPQSVKSYMRSSMSDTDFKAILQGEITAGRAVCFHGHDPKKNYGHCFNLDGWDGNNFYHVNWGWGGANNGNFSLDALRDATMDMDYTDSQGMIVGIRPPSNNPSDIIISNRTVAEKQPAGTVVGSVSVECEDKNPNYTFKIQGPYSPITHKYVTAPFEIVDGNLVTTKELSMSSTANWNIKITVTNTNNNSSFSKDFTISVVSAEAIDGVTMDDNTTTYGVYDTTGRRVAEHMNDIPSGKKGIFIEHTAKGARKLLLK